MPELFQVIPSTTLGNSPITLPSYNTLANTAPSPSEQQLTLAAANAPLRYSYGPVRLAPLVLNALTAADGSLLLDCFLGEGPIGGVTAFELNDAAVPAGVTYTAYDGTQTTADATLVAAWAAQGVVYTDVRPGMAYAVVKIAPTVDVAIDARSLAFTVQGLKVVEPRTNCLNLPGLSGSFASAPDSVAASITGDIDIRVQVLMTDWTPAFAQVFAAKYTAGQASYIFFIEQDGYLRWFASSNGSTNTDAGLSATVPTGIPDGAVYWVRVTKNATTGDLKFYKSPDGVAWTQVGATVAGAIFSIFNSTAGVEIGTYAGGTAGFGQPNTKIFRCLICSGIGGSVAVDFNPSSWSSGATWTSATGEVWTINGSATIVKSPALVTLSAPAYSSNPALALANFLADPVRGPGDAVDWASVAVVADRNDTLLATKKRNTLGITFDEQRPKRDVEETLRAAAACFVVREGPVTYLVADAPVDVSTTLSLAAADWQPKELRYSQRDAASAPNRITVRYTNTAVKPWAEAYTEPIETADVTAGLVDAVEMVVNATWIQDYAEAIRLRNRYFAEHTLGLKTLEFPVFEKGYKVRRGDVIRLTNGSDLAAKPVRVQKITALGFARVKIAAQEYQDAMYSDDTPTGPTYPGTALTDPRTVLPVSALTMAEEVYLDQSQSAAIASGAKYVSRMRAGWTRSPDRYLLDNWVRFKEGTTLIFEGVASGVEYVSPTVQQGKSYTLEVQARNVLGFYAGAVTASAVALGKNLRPGDVPRISQALEIGGEVLLAWDPAIDIDVIRYEWRYTPGTTAGSWDSATLIDRIDGLRARFKGLAVGGPSRFYVKAIDSVGLYSVNATYVDVTITIDSASFLQAVEFTNPTASFNYATYRIDGEQHDRWITAWPTSWNSNFTAAMSTYTNPIATYGFVAFAISRFEGEIADIGVEVNGHWTQNSHMTALAGAIGEWFNYGPTSPPGSATSGLTLDGAARYIRAMISTNVSGAAWHITAPPSISLAAQTRDESGGPVTSNAGSAKTITLAGKYFKAARITITPRGTVARSSTLDNVALSLSGANTFDVYLFDQAGTQVASDFDWSFEGV